MYDVVRKCKTFLMLVCYAIMFSNSLLCVICWTFGGSDIQAEDCADV